MKFDKIYVANNEINKDEFIKKFLLSLATNPKTTYNIFEYFILNGIEEGYDDYYKISGYGTYKITCDIGYQRKILDKNFNHKIVYDWSYYETNISDSSYILLKEGNDNAFTANLNQIKYRNLIDNYKTKFYLDMNQAISSPNINFAEAMIQKNVINKVKLQGDKQKNEQYTGDTTITEIEGYRIPTCILKYKFKNMELQATGFLNNEIEINYVYPQQEKDLSKKSKSDKMKIRLDGLNKLYRELGYPLLTDAEKSIYLKEKDDINLLTDEQRKTLKKLLIIGCCCCLCDLGICFIIRAYKKNKWIKEAKQRKIQEETENKLE